LETQAHTPETSWAQWTQGELEEIRAAGRWRATVAFDGPSVQGRVGGRDVISFASNDYLGLSAHPQVRAAAIEAVERWGSGAGASRLITGTRSLHHALEAAVAQWKGTERALLFSTGYAANLGVLQVLGAADATIFSDELNHASIIDGCRLSRARAVVFRHNDVTHLSELMEATAGRKIVVTEAVFSMDGDAASLQALGELCAVHGAMLVVDEAHSVFGPSWPHDCEGLEYLRVGTLSKALGALGGWAAGSANLIDLLVNRARTFIFTTAPTPANAAGALAALAVYRGPEGDALRTKLRGLVDLLRPEHPSAVVPYILGENARALGAAQQLFEQGMYVPAIRPPTVPAGTARLRVALSAAHTEDMVMRLRAALDQLGA